MPIRPFLNGAAFEPEAIRNMSVVFESVCAELGLSDKDDPATRLVASKIIEFARSGKLRFSPETLRFVDLDAAQINAALDALQDSIDHVRTVIVPRV